MSSNRASTVDRGLTPLGASAPTPSPPDPPPSPRGRMPAVECGPEGEETMSKYVLSRRGFVGATFGLGSALLLAACGATPPAPTSKPAEPAKPADAAKPAEAPKPTEAPKP